MDKSARRTATVLAVLTILNLAVIWCSSLLSVEDSSRQSSFITSILITLFGNADFDALEHIVRKCAHFSEFASLGALSLGLTYTITKYDLRRTWSATALPALGCLLSASTDETIQIFANRGNSVSDVLLDFSGSVTAMCVFYIVVLIIRAKKRRDAPPEDGNTDICSV